MGRVTFEVGDRVRIDVSSEFFNEGSPFNPIDTGGTINEIKDRGMPIRVQWDNSMTNTYWEDDLIHLSEVVLWT